LISIQIPHAILIVMVKISFKAIKRDFLEVENNWIVANATKLKRGNEGH
jgi:hypothetical protein